MEYSVTFCISFIPRVHEALERCRISFFSDCATDMQGVTRLLP